MRFAYFPGCKIPFHLPQYDVSVRAISDRLGIGLTDFDFNCCGNPVRHQSLAGALLSSAKIMAMARKYHLPVLTPCKCCYGNLMHTEFRLKNNENLRAEINKILAKDGLKWTKGGPGVFHLLSVLDKYVGIETIKKAVIKPLTGVKIAAHYGCHALRPARIVKFDDPLNPVIFERLIKATGATPIDWPMRLECCGNPVWETNPRLSENIMEAKLKDAQRAGADIIATACTHCQIQFDSVRQGLTGFKPSFKQMPSVLFTQILGIGLGLEDGSLGFGKHTASVICSVISI